MKPYKALFEKYKEGRLPESEIEELNHILVDSYFLYPSELSKDELEYTEDMIIEMYVCSKLEVKSANRFKELLKTNKMLSRKFNLLRNLSEANKRMNQASRLIASEKAETEQEEEIELAKILHEVIEKVHSENDTSLVNSKLQIFLSQINKLFNTLVTYTLPAQPRLRTALVFASVVIIAGIVWVSVNPKDKKLISSNSDRDTSQNNFSKQADTNLIKADEVKHEINKPQYAHSDSVSNNLLIKDQVAHIQKADRMSDSASRELEMALLAYAEEIPNSIDYIELRSESSTANDLFIEAAEKYNNKNYDDCEIILSGLLKTNEFKSIDTLSEINFYLGVISMKNGFDEPNRKFLKQSIRYFSKVDKSSSYFNDARWYTALSEIRLGNKTNGLFILNSLPENHFQRAADVILIKEKLLSVVHSK